MYTSFTKKRIRSDNSYAITKTGEFVQLHDFIVDKTTRKEIVIARIVKTAQIENFDFLPMLFVTEISEELIAINISTIDRICVFIDNTNQQYICPVPNLLHY